MLSLSLTLFSSAYFAAFFSNNISFCRDQIHRIRDLSNDVSGKFGKTHEQAINHGCEESGPYRGRITKKGSL
jgi:hypothetical protein